jgi:hypothetical protein
VDTFTLVVVLRVARDVDEVTTPTLRVWRDDADPTLWRGSTDCAADDLEGALLLGRDVANEIVAAGPVDAAVEEVVAMDDERQLVWRAKP